MNTINFWQIFFTGLCGAFGVFIANLIREYYCFWRDQRSAYKSFVHLIELRKEGYQTTKAIAIHANMTMERVRVVCSKNPKMKMADMDDKHGEKWRLTTNTSGNSNYATK